MTAILRPHQARLAPRSARERAAIELFDRLWEVYRQRVAHARVYEQIVANAGAAFDNDHLAFRTLATQEPFFGVATLGRLFEALGYRAHGCFDFPDKHLGAIYYQHPAPRFPKIFISELRLWDVSPRTRDLIVGATRTARSPVPLDLLAEVAAVDAGHAPPAGLVDALLRVFHDLPWPPPEKTVLEQVHAETQYGAWVLAHGCNVNHFTSLVNSHGVASLGDIEKTAAALSRAGVPMKAAIEGAPGSPLRQTATEAVVIEIDARHNGQPTRLPWSYAYFELAQRDEQLDPATGERKRFEGFFGPQATTLFEMTAKRKA